MTCFDSEYYILWQYTPIQLQLYAYPQHTSLFDKNMCLHVIIILAVVGLVVFLSENILLSMSIIFTFLLKFWSIIFQQKHLKECPMERVLCPVGCAETLLRGKITKHKEECPQRSILCGHCKENIHYCKIHVSWKIKYWSNVLLLVLN